MIELVLFKEIEYWQRYLKGFASTKLFPKETFLKGNYNGTAFSSIVTEDEVQKHNTIIIEQPEIGLHPVKHAISTKHICYLARKFPEKKFILASHSKTTIDLFGDYIEDGIHPELKDTLLIKVLKEHEEENKVSGFDADGYLVNWEIGYMSGRQPPE